MCFPSQGDSCDLGGGRYGGMSWNTSDGLQRTVKSNLMVLAPELRLPPRPAAPSRRGQVRCAPGEGRHGSWIVAPSRSSTAAGPRTSLPPSRPSGADVLAVTRITRDAPCLLFVAYRRKEYAVETADPCRRAEAVPGLAQVVGGHDHTRRGSGAILACSVDACTRSGG